LVTTHETGAVGDFYYVVEDDTLYMWDAVEEEWLDIGSIVFLAYYDEPI
jgi:hypothetical protein